MSDSETLALTKALMRCPSVTPDDAGCQAIIAERLEHLGFSNEHLRLYFQEALIHNYNRCYCLLRIQISTKENPYYY